MRRIQVLALLLGAFALAPAWAQEPSIDASCSTDAVVRYFPAGAFQSSWSGSDEFMQDWYSEHLRAMAEPSLVCNADAADEGYRFLLLRTFDHPIAVRISRRGRRYELDATELDGAGGYGPGNVARRISRPLSRREWNTAIAALERLRFWDMPSVEDERSGTDPETGEEVIVVHADGAQWILEGRSARYHVVDRWGGEDGVRKVGVIFLGLAGLSPEPLY